MSRPASCCRSARTPIDQRGAAARCSSKRRSRSRARRRSSTCRAPGSAKWSENERIPGATAQWTQRHRSRSSLPARPSRRASRPAGRMQGGVSIAVAGGQSFGVAYLLDGAMHNNPQNNVNLPLPFPDALQEFSVATSGLSAQTRHALGGRGQRGDEVGHQPLLRQSVRVPPRQAVQRHAIRLRSSGPTASGRTMGCSATSSAGRWADRLSGTSSFSSAPIRAPRSVRRRPTTSPLFPRLRCWPATLPLSPHPHATAADRSTCGRVREQPDRSRALQSRGAEPRQEASQRRPIRAARSRTARPMTATKGRPWRRSTINGTPIIPCSDGTWPPSTRNRRPLPATENSTGNAAHPGLDNLAQSLAVGDTLRLRLQHGQLASVCVQSNVHRPRQPPLLRSAGSGLQRLQLQPGGNGPGCDRRVQHLGGDSDRAACSRPMPPR